MMGFIQKAAPIIIIIGFLVYALFKVWEYLKNK